MNDLTIQPDTQRRPAPMSIPFLRPSSPSGDDLEEPELSRVCGSVFAYGGRVSKLPDLNRPLMETVRQVGIPVLAKSEALDAFARLLNCGYTLVFRRPRTYGIDWFTAMLAAYLDYDWDLDDFIPRLLGPRQRRPGLHHHFVLHLDLVYLRRDPDLGSALMRYCHARCQDFVDRHSEELAFMGGFLAASNYPTAQFMIAELGMYLQARGAEPLFVIVNNFDAAVHAFPTEIAVLTEFLNGLGAYIHDGIGGVLLASEQDDGTGRAAVVSVYRKEIAELPEDSERRKTLRENARESGRRYKQKQQQKKREARVRQREQRDNDIRASLALLQLQATVASSCHCQ
ncbi:hypothetical protein MKEN_00380900 [Mycena kentingensis (nom. inval.)]|nr:hypothetical protein MKEN_00380900 [Mycena kentingensis (nom. inval.)]